MNYKDSKTSIYIENQLPTFVKKEGENFIEFLKTYYNWLEKKVAIVVLKAKNEIDDNDIEIGDNLESMFYLLTDEEGNIIIDEDFEETTVFQNDYSLYFDGENDHAVVDNPIVDVTSDWTISCWIKIDNIPSLFRNDFDVITLNNESYLSILNISKDSNTVGFKSASTTIDTSIVLTKDKWYYVTIRYDSTEKSIRYDVISDSSENHYEAPLNLLTYSSNKFVIGCDLFNSRNFFNGTIDELGIWNKRLSDTENETIYNDGTCIDLQSDLDDDYTSSSSLTNYFRFSYIEEDQTTLYNEISGGDNATLFNEPEFVFDVPYNIPALISESRENYTISLNVLSYKRIDGGVEGVMSNRMLVFVEHVYGKLKKDIVLKYTPTNTILISDFTEIKNPLDIINNIQNYQDIDFIFDYNNFISNDYFKFLWKEIMHGFPLFLYPKIDENMKSIIGKNIKEFYRTKGTYKAIKLLFKLLYNEDLEIGTHIYTDEPYTYTIKTNYAGSSDLQDFIKRVCHPVGYKLKLISK